MKKIINWYNELKLHQKIFVLLIIAIILFLLTRLLPNNKNERIYSKYTNSLNYSEISIESLMDVYELTIRNRDDYLAIEEIINNMNDRYKDKTLKDYYSTLDTNFKKKISKTKFSKKINDIFSKIEDDKFEIMPYKYENSSHIYLVKICNNDEVYGYVGLILNYDINKYSIFYIE